MKFGPLDISFNRTTFEDVSTERETPTPDFLKEVSAADSSLYEKYQLRPYNPDELYQKKGNYDLFDEMRQDEQISAVLSLKKMMVLDSEWEIVSNTGSEDLDVEISKFLEDNLRNDPDEIFEKKIYNILSAYDYGFSMTEEIFKIEDGKYKLSNLKTRAPHSFEFEQDKHGNIVNVKQDTEGGELDLDLSKFIHYSFQQEFDNPYGKSELNLGVYTAWWSKVAIRKFWNIYLERFGMPTVVGKYPSSYTQHKSILQKVLKNIQAKTSITVPEEISIDLLERQGGGTQSDYESAINHYNMSIARKLLIPDLMGFGGGKVEGGSYSLGQEHFSIFYNVIEQNRKEISSLINKNIIHPLVNWNWGVGLDVNFKFSKVDEYKKERDLKMWVDAVNGGKIPVLDKHINWFLNQIEAPEIEKEEFDEIESKKEEIRSQINGNEQVDEQSSGQPDEKEKSKPGEKLKDTPKKIDMQFSDGLSSIERKVDFQKVNDSFDNIENKYIPILEKAFEVIINGLLSDIERRQIIEKKKIAGISKLGLRNVALIKKAIGGLLEESYSDGTKSTSYEFELNDPSVLNSEQVSEWLEFQQFKITGIENQKILDITQEILVQGIRDGSSAKEIIKMITDALSPWGVSQTKTTPARIETIVRTNLSSAFNQARLDQFSEISSEIIAYNYSAILDGRTSDVCLSLDSTRNNQLYTADEVAAINPPNHFNCRSIIVPVFKFEQDEIVDYKFSGIPGNLQKTNGSFYKVRTK